MYIRQDRLYFFLFQFTFLYSRFLLVIYFIHISVYMPLPISQFIPSPPPPPPLSPLGAHMFVLYICVSIDKTDFKTKMFSRDKEGHYHLMIKGSIQEADTTVNVYAPNIGAPKYIKQIQVNIKGETESNTIIVGDFNTPFTSMDRSSKKKINMETRP